MLATGATLAGILLPATDLPLADLDEGVAEVMAQVAQRLLERHAEWAGQRRLMARDLGCIDPHVASGAAVRRQLRKRGISADELMVDTPEIWQGLERPIMVVKHTLSGLPRLSSFSLEPGRWCVMLSRHQLGCVIVGREGIGAALERHRHNCADRPMGVDNAEWAGWRAHVALWGSMERMGRIVRA